MTWNVAFNTVYNMIYDHKLQFALDEFKQAISEKKSNIAPQVHQLLREQIISGVLTPGQHLVEQALASQLSVSRTPLREAFRLLAAENLVEILPNRGVVVARFTAEEIEQRLVYLGGLLGLASSLTVPLMQEADFAELERLNDAMHDSARDPDRTQWVADNNLFHISMLAHCPNWHLLTQCTREGERLWRYWALTFDTIQSLDVYMSEHVDLIKAARHRDADTVMTLTYHHVAQFAPIAGKMSVKAKAI